VRRLLLFECSRGAAGVEGNRDGDDHGGHAAAGDRDSPLPAACVAATDLTERLWIRGERGASL
jgi:hypothetical protein